MLNGVQWNAAFRRRPTWSLQQGRRRMKSFSLRNACNVKFKSYSAYNSRTRHCETGSAHALTEKRKRNEATKPRFLSKRMDLSTIAAVKQAGNLGEDRHPCPKAAPLIILENSNWTSEEATKKWLSQTHASSASCSKWYSVAQFCRWIAKHSDFRVKCIFCLAGHFCNVLGVDEKQQQQQQKPLYRPASSACAIMYHCKCCSHVIRGDRFFHFSLWMLYKNWVH